MPGQFYPLRREWKGATTVKLHFPAPLHRETGPHNSTIISSGPLVYSLKVGADWKKLRDRGPFADWEVLPTTPWNYALEVDFEGNPLDAFRWEQRPVGPMPFSPDGAPIFAHVKGRRVPGWKLEHNAAGPVPSSPVATKEPLEDLTLVPYGCTTLRITEFPTTK